MRTACLAALMLVACSDDAASPADIADVLDVTNDATADATDVTNDVDDIADIGDIADSSDTGSDAGPVVFSVSLVESTSAGDSSAVAFATAGRIFTESTANGTTVGECTFYPAAPPPFCDPACAIGTVCVADGVCDDPLEPLSAGDISVTGLTVALSLHPETQYFYYTPTYTPEPSDGDLFADDASIVATSEGANVASFSITAGGVDDTATTLACPPTMSGDAALEVRWTAGDAGEVHFDLESGNHGGQFARIACDGPDDGTFVIDAALMDRYVDAARPLDLWRLARRNTASSGRALLIVSSEVSCRW